ncbi:MAG: CapA family protein [Myxococcales bacterium]|nr:CapA family protein [Myxococcales bacterium]
MARRRVWMACLALAVATRAPTTTPSRADELAPRAAAVPPGARPADEPAPAPAAPPLPPPPAPIQLAFVGDVMFGRYVARTLQPIPASPRLLAAAHGPLRAADLAIANLETPIVETPPRRGPSERRRFVGSAAHVALLAAAGIDAVSLANNHADDMDDAGAAATVAILARHGIAALGSAVATPPAVRVETLDAKGWRLAIVAVTTVRNRSQRPGALELPYLAPADLAAVAGPVIAHARPQHHRVIVLVHWGTEGRHHPAAWQRQAAHALVDAGADLVIGSHPHVLQPIERYRDGVIAYSLGNFVFDNRAPRQSRTAVLTIGLTPGEPCAAVRVTPMALGPGYRPRRAGRADARLVRQALGAVAPCAR